jgi:hypothetical protein
MDPADPSGLPYNFATLLADKRVHMKNTSRVGRLRDCEPTPHISGTYCQFRYTKSWLHCSLSDRLLHKHVGAVSILFTTLSLRLFLPSSPT